MLVETASLVVALVKAFLAGVAVALIATLTFDDVISWFRESPCIIGDEDELVFSLNTHLENGEFEFIQGVLDERTNEVRDARKVRTRKLDARLARAHKRKPLAIYT